MTGADHEEPIRLRAVSFAEEDRLMVAAPMERFRSRATSTPRSLLPELALWISMAMVRPTRSR